MRNKIGCEIWMKWKYMQKKIQNEMQNPTQKWMQKQMKYFMQKRM